MKQSIEELLPRPSVMGVVNVTPDSFSDGGAFLHPQAAIAEARGMLDEGAAIVDVGGESTRPGSEGVSVEEELDRVEPVLAALVDVPVSIDTSKAEVARRALEAGAVLVNDVTALRGEPALAGVVADSGACLCLMHMLGEPRTMQDDPRYDDVVSEVKAFLEERLEFATERRDRRGTDLPRPRDRLRQDRGAQPRAARPPGRDRRARAARAGRCLPQALSRPAPGRRRSAYGPGLGRSGRSRRSPTSAVRRSSASMTCASTWRPLPSRAPSRR